MSIATSTKKELQQEARDLMHAILEDAGTTTVYTIVQHASASGQQRSIRVLVAGSNGADGHTIMDVSGIVARATGRRFDHDRGGVICKGSGMDMTFDLVYSLSMALYCPDTYDHDAAYRLNRIAL